MVLQPSREGDVEAMLPHMAAKGLSPTILEGIMALGDASVRTRAWKAHV